MITTVLRHNMKFDIVYVLCVVASPLLAPFLLKLIPAWISNYILHNVWDEITYPFAKFNGSAVEIW